MPLAQSLQARDKQKLFQRGNMCIVFDLDAATFQRPTQFNTPAALEELRRHLCPHSDKSVQLLASPCSHVTVSEQTRITAGIPAGAVFFCFCYPLAATSYMVNQSSDTVSEDMKARMAALQAKINTADPFACLLMAGAFLYLDEVYDVVAINSFYFAEVPAAMRHLNSVIHLGRGSALPRAAALALGEGGRFLPALSACHRPPPPCQGVYALCLDQPLRGADARGGLVGVPAARGLCVQAPRRRQELLLSGGADVGRCARKRLVRGVGAR